MKQAEETIPPTVEENVRRFRFLNILTELFPKITDLQISETDFKTSDIEKVSNLVKYSIHPIYASSDVFQAYVKLSDYYWSKADRLGQKQQRRQRVETIQESDPNVSAVEDVPHTVPQVQILGSSNAQSSQEATDLCVGQKTNEEPVQNFISAEQNKPKKVVLKKIAKSYSAIRLFLNDFKLKDIPFEEEVRQSINTDKFNSWASKVYTDSSLIFQPKAPLQKKMSDMKNKNVATSNEYIQKITQSKESVEAPVSETKLPAPLILGKNESIEMKEIKSKIIRNAKVDFVETKLKEEEKMEEIQKKTIAINYLLNIMANEFFEEIANDITKIILSEVRIVPILCEKVVEKVKEEHNFIEVYVKLIKRLTLLAIEAPTDEEQANHKSKRHKNYLHTKFIQILQSQFFELIESDFELSGKCEAEIMQTEYKNRKNVLGLCIFMGKLIKCEVLTRKVFKVCFWEMTYQYVTRVKCDTEKNCEILNENLIQGIVTIADNMGKDCLQKQMLKEQRNITEEITDETQVYEKLLHVGLVENQKEQYLELIEKISIANFPYMLKGLLKAFESKRMKLMFLIEGWQNRIEEISESIADDKAQSKISRTEKEEGYLVIEQSDQKVERERQSSQALRKQVKDWIQEELFESEVSEVAKLTEQLQRFPQSDDTSEKCGWLQQHTDEEAVSIFVSEYLLEFTNTPKKNILTGRLELFKAYCCWVNQKKTSKFGVILDIISTKLEDLMMVDCDLPFLAEALAEILVFLLERVENSVNQQGPEFLNSLPGFKSVIEQEDDDTLEFIEKVLKGVQTIEERR